MGPSEYFLTKFGSQQVKVHNTISMDLIEFEKMF